MAEPEPKPVPPKAAPQAVGGYGRLAQRMAGYTSNLLAIIIVCGGGLAIGRQTLLWWRASPLPVQSETSPASTDWGANGAPVLLRFGEHPVSILRQEIEGDKPTAENVLFGHCERLVTAETDLATLPPPTDAERRWLKSLAALTPVIEQHGLWRIYQVGGGLRTVAAIREGREPRLICWGFVVPLTEQRWALYVMQSVPQPLTPRTDPHDLPEITLPPGSRLILSLTEATGGTLLGLTSEQPENGAVLAEKWRAHFDTFFTEHGWHSPAGWRVTEGLAQARFVPQTGQPIQWAEVQLRFGPDGASGLINLVKERAR